MELNKPRMKSKGPNKIRMLPNAMVYTTNAADDLLKEAINMLHKFRFWGSQPHFSKNTIPPWSKTVDTMTIGVMNPIVNLPTIE